MAGGRTRFLMNFDDTWYPGHVSPRRHVFEDLGYRRYECKCDSLSAPSRRAALAARVHARGGLPAAHNRQRAQPRRGQVLDVEPGVAPAHKAPSERLEFTVEGSAAEGGLEPPIFGLGQITERTSRTALLLDRGAERKPR